MSIKPLKLHGASQSPNPVKVGILLEELGIPYEGLKVPEVKEEPFISLNPNGRVPALEDPNTGVTIFESGAILEYLIATYDKENKLNHPSGQDHWTEKSFLHFQMSGQGPYFGQFAWFSNFHGEV
ncbi:thioredoxin-like protein [Microthyrium microscopicum]|uniref:Thioredoxin-like protein n=1 Tax=Microthyrium microscopicum TaxID=703497 RepID=A0A6A6UHH7_9PEZI|nr:thioredoxin-like protein [Microthyrium microscopicum]